MKLSWLLISIGIILLLEGTFRIGIGLRMANYGLSAGGLLTGWLLGGYLLKKGMKRRTRIKEENHA